MVDRELNLPGTSQVLNFADEECLNDQTGRRGCGGDDNRCSSQAFATVLPTKESDVAEAV